jgi:hypothetical protein
MKGDSFTRTGAGLLSQKIEAYWRARGFEGIRVRREPMKGEPDMYQVRSNIGANGFPPRVPWSAADGQ